MLVAAGTVIDRYRIESPLGQGGMGQVFRAFDLRLRRPVAVKILHELLSPEGMTRLVREARLAASLQHPNIVAVYDVGESEGVAFMAMELLEGKTLRALAREDVSIAQRVRWLVDVARGLDAAHRAGLVHRDVKPQNVLVTADTVKLLDFGVAKELDAEVRKATALLPSLRTQPGYSMGTPHYMAPEILIGDRNADERTDQFSWGVVAYELLVGPLPKRRDFEPGGSWTGPELSAPGLNPRAARVVERTLAPDREARFRTMGEVATALEATLTALPATLHQAPPSTVRDEAPESMPDGRGATNATRMLAVQSVAPPAAPAGRASTSASAPPPAPPVVREPKASVLAPLVDAALDVLARDVPGGFRQAVIIVTLDVEGRKARFFVQLVATDTTGDLWTPEASPGLGKAAATAITADAVDGNGRWTRLVLRLQAESREASIVDVA